MIQEPLSRLHSLPPTFPATVASLHRVAEEVVSPAQPDGEIALIATPGGFGTPVFDDAGVPHQVRVDGTDLVRRAGGEEQRAPLDVDPAAAGALADWYALGAAVLAQFGGAAATPTLWPEHFDIAIELGEEPARATYGFSPGDEHHAEPYAYVGPWTAEVEGALWQAHGFRGAELTYAELLAATDPRAAALDFFETRRAAL